jgi:transposase
VARMGEGRYVHRVLVVKPEGKRPLGRPDVDGRIILRGILACGAYGGGERCAQCVGGEA